VTIQKQSIKTDDEDTSTEQSNSSTESEDSGKGSDESPKELPNTGPGAIAPIAFGTSFSGSMIYSYRRRYADILAKLVSRF
jgi:hypothetical protein